MNFRLTDRDRQEVAEMRRAWPALAVFFALGASRFGLPVQPTSTSKNTMSFVLITTHAITRHATLRRRNDAGQLRAADGPRNGTQTQSARPLKQPGKAICSFLVVGWRPQVQVPLGHIPESPAVLARPGERVVETL